MRRVRAQGIADTPFSRLGNRYNWCHGVLIVERTSLTGPAALAGADGCGIFLLGNQTSTGAVGLQINAAPGDVQFRIMVAGVDQAAVSCSVAAPAAGETIRCTLARDTDAGLVQVAARGAGGATHGHDP